MSLLAIAQTQAQPKAPAKSRTSKTPVVDVPGMGETIRLWREYKAIQDEAETIVKQAKADITAWFDRYREVNTTAKSITVQDGEQSCKIVPVNKFSVNATDDQPIREIMGDDFDHFFSVEYGVKLRTEALNDPNLDPELAAMLKKHWATLFDTTATLKVTGDLDSEILRMDGEKRRKLAEFVKQQDYQVRKA